MLRFDRFIDVSLLPPTDEFIASQSHQAWIRFVLGIVFTAYIAFHGPYFSHILPVLSIVVPMYLLINLVSLFWIRRVPYSLPRLLLFPLLDNALIVLAMWADGGHMSVAYFLLMSPIFGNGFRYGSRMMAYCQVLALVSLALAALITVAELGLPLDGLGLCVEMVGVLYLSGYAYSIINRTEDVVRARIESDEAASRLIAENPHPAFTFDPRRTDFPVEFANAAMASLTAVEPCTLVGRPAAELVINEDRDAFLQAIRHHAQDGLQQCYVRMPGTGDSTIQVKCEFTRIRQRGRQIGLCYLTDISEHERLQGELAEAQKLAYAAALAAGIAHDFRNLLTGMIGQAELIAMNRDDPALRDELAEIIAAGQRGAEMVNQLLELGRGNASEYKVQDISDAIRRMLQVARVQLPPNIELRVRVSQPLPKVAANIAQLEQLLLNLIANAAQAMPEGKGCIEVELASRERRGVHGVEILVRDNGCGIKKENLQHIFKPFWSTRKGSGGTGLGMSMVLRIVRWHQGQIDVDSEEGSGTEVRIFLPEATAPIRLPAASDGRQDEPVQRRMHPWGILLVEDQADVMRVHQGFLTRMGHRVLVAADGRQALELFREHRHEVDMVLTDYMMPEMHGMQLIAQLRRQAPELPMTIVTAYGEDDALKHASRYRVQILAKPVSYRQLYRHILMLQGQSRQAAERQVS